MLKSSQVKPHLFSLLICIIAFFVFLNLLTDKYQSFGYYDWDLAIYSNAMWALKNGTFTGSLWGINFLTNHAEYIALLLCPIYWLFPSALTLITFKILSLTGASFVLFLIAKKDLGWIRGLLIQIAFLTFPANLFMLIFEFHFENLTIILLFLIYYHLYVRPNLAKFVIYCVLASLCKENIAPVIFMIGLISFLTHHNTSLKYSYSAIFIGAGIFILSMFIVTPLIRHQAGSQTLLNPYFHMYWVPVEHQSWFGNIKINVNRVLDLILSPNNLAYLKDLFVPFVFLPFFYPQTLLMGLPLFIQNLISANPAMHTIFYHYAATLTPFIFLATVKGLNQLEKKFNKKQHLIFLILIFTLACNFYNYFTILAMRTEQWHNSENVGRETLIKQIPDQEGVSASFEFLSHLANRDHIYPFRSIWQGVNQFNSYTPFHIPQTEWALINWDDPWLEGDIFFTTLTQAHVKLERIKNFYFNGNWEICDAWQELTLLKKLPTSTKVKNHLVQILNTPENNSPKQPAILSNQDISLLSVKLDKSLTNNISGTIPLSMLWQSHKVTTHYYGVHISFLNKGRSPSIPIQHTIGYFIYPTNLWKEGEHILEHYWIKIPNHPHNITIKITLWDINTNQPANRQTGEPNTLTMEFHDTAILKNKIND